MEKQDTNYYKTYEAYRDIDLTKILEDGKFTEADFDWFDDVYDKVLDATRNASDLDDLYIHANYKEIARVLMKRYCAKKRGQDIYGNMVHRFYADEDINLWYFAKKAGMSVQDTYEEIERKVALKPSDYDEYGFHFIEQNKEQVARHIYEWLQTQPDDEWQKATNEQDEEDW